MSSSDMKNSDFTIKNILSSEKDSSGSKEFINFTVQNKAGEIVSINANVNESIKNLQERIQNQCGILLNEQIFSCFGESTLWSGNNGMQQTFNDLNEIRVNVNEMKNGKAQQRINELEVKKAENETKNNFEVNDETSAQIVEQKDLAQKSETEVCQISNQIIELRKENAEFIDQSRICTIKDIFDINGEIDYERLNGKILEVDKLKYSGCERKWLADDDEISLKNSDFLVCPKELRLFSHSNLSANILNRIVCNNLKSLYLIHVTIIYSDYKKLLAKSPKLELSLWRVTVMDESGIKLKIDEVWKEAKYVKSLAYQFKDGEVTSETAQKLAELPPFPNLSHVFLQNVQESFDLKIFGEFLNKNQTIEYCKLLFECSDKFYKEIKRAQNDLLPKLPSTCEFVVKKN